MTLEARNISFQYPASNFRLRGVSFAVGSGESVALTGPNGSGKTTLGKLVCGLLKPDSGAVLFDGEDAAPLTLAQRGQRVGYLFQEPARQLFAPTALEELTFTQVLAGVPAEEASACAMELLERFELAHLVERAPLTLSRGEQQRLAICTILVRAPGILILDEPTTGLDPRRCALLAEALREVMRGGTSVLLISHDRVFVTENAMREVKMEEINAGC